MADDSDEVQRLRSALAQVAEERDRLEERRDALLAQVASISQSTPLPSEIEGWEAQRAALVAEVGTLRAAVAEAERARDAVLTASYEHGKVCGQTELRLHAALAYLARSVDGYDHAKEIAEDIAAGRRDAGGVPMPRELNREPQP